MPNNVREHALEEAHRRGPGAQRRSYAEENVLDHDTAYE
jgi:hypothetical protein